MLVIDEENEEDEEVKEPGKIGFSRINRNKIGIYNEEPLQAILDLQDKQMKEF